MVKKMSSFSGLEIGLGVLFVCILLVLSAELYYLLFWKKRLSKKRVDVENQHIPSSNITHSSYTSCWKTSKSIKTQEKDMQTHIKQQDSDMGLGKDLVLKGLGDESLDLELMRLHNLCGPPRFLFTINEETKEDLESEVSKKGSRTGSFSDILDTLGTPFLSPLASPLKVPQQHNLEAYAYNYNGMNPLFDSNEFGINKMRSSPPPSFKFLRDAEEKLLKRLMQMEGEKRGILKSVDQDSPRKQEGKDASFVKFVVSKGKSEGGHHLVSTSSKVLPLPCSPTKTTMATIDKKR
ncbi:hypothetical protein HanRHA438_Chr05g0207231 [Helianthus annuus]|uniref:Membrane lipoprotein n=1 Tax=Helianthus annuus TaxID=4232 RepID=A0A251UND4_HELAN|nr:uncharacterized protein LOC110940020 [Helianthus annuus]KAF5804494.1 hypothetical protein HanXRQr2_Chr05g0197681 [Helianthus annuus]KAJ0569109.1 hypothetical protein HanHA300_Chr05g0162311 [Helianthus annuus]KAJ0583403.1 hypothetical protein HanHA89_Chr05g0176171 [Helianthus annuus]KAJ0746139.1 hypothetical protein HanOQP8_Chr05g0174121 [Helianthus annuus]KAJ0749141.1 hypothetical protein HanLR1_Chr05g0166391 [Helianthus annuus]